MTARAEDREMLLQILVAFGFSTHPLPRDMAGPAL